MPQDKDGVEGYDDPTLGVAPEHNDEFLGETRAGNFGDVTFDYEEAGMLGSVQVAGNEDLFGDLLPNPGTSAADASVNTPAAELGALEAQSAFDFPQIDPVINPAVTAEASQSLQGQLSSPSSVLPKTSANQAHQDLVPGRRQMLQAPEIPDQGRSKAPEQNLADLSQNQARYLFRPSLGQGNGANQVAAGQGAAYGNQFQYNAAYGNPTYAAPPAPHIGAQFGGFANMFAQPAHNLHPGYPLNAPQVMPNPMDMRGQGYPAAFMPPMLGLGVPVPHNAQLPMLSQLNQPANPPPLNQSVAPGQGHPLNGTKMNHKRNRRGSPSNDPSQFYAAPIGLLRPWGPKVVVGKNRQEEHMFRYYQQTAELRPSLTYTRQQLVTFFLGHGHPYPRRRLTLWIQNTPAQINERYANRSDSSKCRYRDCPAKQNTILKGFFRVAFDEFSDETGTVRDPFRNAGYMHLHCFESVFDLAYLIHHGAARHNFRILPDRRHLIHESRNPASINRDHGEMIEAYDAWVEGQKARADRLEQDNAARPRGQEYTGFDPAPRMILPHAQRLGRSLTDKHLSLQVKGRAATRESRGGVHIGIHRGDLDLFVHLHHQKSRGVPVERALAAVPGQEGQGAGAATSAHDRGKKRARDEYDDDESNDESNSMSSDSLRNSRRPKCSKRQHTPNDPGPSGTRPDVRPRTAGRKRGLGELDDTPASSAPKRPKQYHIPSSSSKGKEVVRPAPLLPPPPPPPPLQRSYANFPSSAYELRTEDPYSGLNDGRSQSRNPGRPSPLLTFPSTATGGGASTRTRAREAAGNDTVDRLAMQAQPTRASAHAIQSRLGHQPAHVRSQVLAAVPEEYAALMLPRSGTLHDDRLAERIGRLGRRQRLEVEQAVGRLERRGSSDKRKCQSL
ncbi:hypothetical protein MYCTH_93648 [Thermothelomyces thermophilus ATCC 42464]|uniref:Uncharacterized protein n=1 Tax=Thermothelomyces thermophilus (strain ATCC 42464 / BCRC 31852 / DSM 1799) TaxID=573729 RepID=G2QCI2_THET4|nr:uncharacterized protein MYCTH_93648 [Thermothelomyces thermophilus ATCC 42464]AEO58158.1 hypothetical protein MYCTH_93648 [Thermothelomyces thermophilus ATCC 42464]